METTKQLHTGCTKAKMYAADEVLRHPRGTYCGGLRSKWWLSGEGRGKFEDTRDGTQTTVAQAIKAGRARNQIHGNC